MNRPVVLALGVCHRDVELAVLWLRWVAFLSGQQEGTAGHLLIVRTHRVTEAQVDAMWGAMRDSNWEARIMKCPDELEVGYPKSASHLFLRTLECAEKAFPGHAVFWCEPDTVPLKPSWEQEIIAEYQTCGKPNLGMLVGTQFPHQSGNSIYAADWRTRFPSIANVLNAPDYKLWGPGKGQPWDVYCRHETTPQMAVTKLMFQIWKERDARATRLRDIPAGTCLFHQDKTGALIREIAAARYPEFMATLNEGRRFYLLNGHASRLRAKGISGFKFSYEKWQVGGWRSAVCSTELSDEHAAALAALVGKFGLSEISEEAFLKLTGRPAKTLPAPKVRTARVASTTPELPGVTHASVFVMLGRYGDILNILPMLKAEADAGRRPTLVVSADFADILDGVSYVDRIVWEGAYDRLPDALRWLARDREIRVPVVCQFHRNPYDRAHLTDSYQKEVWRLAGRLDAFATRGPLVIDRRDEARETALVARFRGLRGPGAPAKPIILVGLESVSSPLENANAIMRAIVERFDATHEILNLSNVKAERIYDLLGLFDEAACLVTADTSFLHLARASKVPVFAIINDGWRGSVVPEGTPHYRYGNADPTSIAAMVAAMVAPAATDYEKWTKTPEDTLTSITYPRVGLTPEELEAMSKDIHDGFHADMMLGTAARIIHVADVFGSDARHHVAQATWQAAYREGIEPAHFRGGPRNAKDELGDPRRLPFLKDVLWSAIPGDARERGGDIIVWTNSDIGLKAGLADVLREHVGKHGAAAMRRTESNGRGHPGRDLFAFTVDWLHAHWDELPDYVLGAPVFDLGLVAMIRKHHGLPFSLKSCDEDLAPADMTPGWALHESHEPEWQVANADAVPSTRHNKKLFREWARKYWPELAFTKGGNLK